MLQTTPFDMVVLNQVSRFDLVKLALKYAGSKPSNAAKIISQCDEMLAKHRAYVVEEMEDLPEVRDFVWKY